MIRAAYLSGIKNICIRIDCAAYGQLSIVADTIPSIGSPVIVQHFSIGCLAGHILRVVSRGVISGWPCRVVATTIASTVYDTTTALRTFCSYSQYIYGCCYYGCFYSRHVYCPKQRTKPGACAPTDRYLMHDAYKATAITRTNLTLRISGSRGGRKKKIPFFVLNVA